MLAPRPYERPLGVDDAGFPAARLLALIGALRAIGADADVVLALAGEHLPRLAAEGDAVPVERLRWFIRALQHAAPLPSLALETGSRLAWGDGGAIDEALACAPDLRTALGLLSRRDLIGPELVTGSTATADGGLWWVIEPALAPGDLRAFLLDLEAARFAAVVRQFAGPGAGEARLEIPWHAPHWRAAYDRLAGRVCFGAGRMAWWLPDALLDRPREHGSADAFAAAWRRCEAEAVDRRERRRLGSRIARLLRGGEPGLHQAEAVAARFGITTRTLFRRLAAEGTSFQAIVDDWRREAARALLEQGGVPVAEIARRLGYRDGSNFSRCLRRWFGQPPQRRGRTGG